jgi:hypothetical protein
MGEIDTVTKAYMSDNARFADVFNYYLFHGKQIIRGQDLRELDPTELLYLLEEETVEHIQKYRDILKQCIIREDGRYHYLLLGIENQAGVHYSMPVRTMLYDALNYTKQLNQLAKEHRQKQDLKGDEFISGFAKTDRLKPVITLTIYWGTEDWDGARSLKELLQEVEEPIGSYINDYRLHLIIPKEIHDFEKFRTELGTALYAIAESGEKEKVVKLSSDATGKPLDADTAKLLETCINLKVKINEGGTTNLGEGVYLFGEDKKAEGRAEGKAEGEYLKLISQIRRKMAKNIYADEIADMLETEIAEIREFMELIGRHPEAKDEQIYELWIGKLSATV